MSDSFRYDPPRRELHALAHELSQLEVLRHARNILIILRCIVEHAPIPTHRTALQSRVPPRAFAIAHQQFTMTTHRTTTTS